MKEDMRAHKFVEGVHLLVIATLLAGLMLMPGPAPAEAAAASTSHSTAIEAGQVPEGLTAEAWASIQAAMKRDRYRFRPAELQSSEAYQAPNFAHNLQATFTPEGVEVAPCGGEPHWRLGLRLLGYGYGDGLQAISPGELVVAENRLEYQRGSLVEWYVNDHRGLQQGFTLQEPPPGREGRGDLQLHLGYSGGLRPTMMDGGTGIEWRDRVGEAMLRYSGLFAYDATGRQLPAHLELPSPWQAEELGPVLSSAEGVRIVVDDSSARYPITVDPWFQVAKLTASDGGANDFFGIVAISGDTVVVGAAGDDSDKGSAYVFVKPVSGWSGSLNEHAKLTASDGQANDFFGISVAVSGDTVVVGAFRHDSDKGSAYVFVKPAGGWTDMTQTAKLTASDGAANDWFGISVATSGDTVVVGALGDNSVKGSAYVFVKPSSGWSGSLNEGAKLTASDGQADDQFGRVAINGDTVVAGAAGDGSLKGSAYVFVKPSGGWSGSLNEDAKLTASDGGVDDQFGTSVAVSGDTVVVGASGDDSYKGSTYVFVKPVGGWTGNLNQDAKLTVSDGAADDQFGISLAVSGTTVVIGAAYDDSGKGSAYVFVKPVSGWSGSLNEHAKLTASDGQADDRFGISVATSGDTVVIGASNGPGSNDSDQGSAYVFFGKPGTIVIEKQTDAGGCSGTFTFEVPNLAPGTYTITEDDPAPGFNLTAITCDDGGSAIPSTGDVGTRTATFNLDPDETVKYTFTNTRIPPVVIGGIVVPVDRLELLALQLRSGQAPWQGLAALAWLATFTVALVRRRKSA